MVAAKEKARAKTRPHSNDGCVAENSSAGPPRRAKIFSGCQRLAGGNCGEGGEEVVAVAVSSVGEQRRMQQHWGTIIMISDGLRRPMQSQASGAIPLTPHLLGPAPLL